MIVPFDDPDMWHSASCFPIDYFVYSSATSPPSLTTLPPLLRGQRRQPQGRRHVQALPEPVVVYHVRTRHGHATMVMLLLMS